MGGGQHREQQHWPAWVTAAGMQSAPCANRPVNPTSTGQSFCCLQGKSAMSLKVIKPTWEQVGNGGLKVAREGTVLVEFAAAQGPRQYDWEKKEVGAGVWGGWVVVCSGWEVCRGEVVGCSSIKGWQRGEAGRCCL